MADVMRQVLDGIMLGLLIACLIVLKQHQGRIDTLERASSCEEPAALLSIRRGR